jgi:oxygen-independent coproporphyrinogen-3 oxidase
MIPIKPVGVAVPSRTIDSAAGVAATYLRPGALNLQALPPLSLYIHWPWCVRKCPYCDFNSHEAKGEVPEQQYLDALRRDLEMSLPLIWGRKIYTVFIGGGTPSLMSAAGMERLMSDLRSLLPLDGACEITMEANPGTFEAEKFRSYRDSGVNRLSIGIQSFNSAHLQALGRIHDDGEARRAVEIALATFDNFNLDLMYALPNQTLEQARQDIETAIGFKPPHLSLYHLTMEPNTVFAKYPPQLPDDDLSADMQDMIAELTTAMPGPATRRATTSITGSSATTLASVPAPTASSPSRTACCARRASSSPSPIWTRLQPATRCRRSANWRARRWASNSC